MEPHCDRCCKGDPENGRGDRTIHCEDMYDHIKGEKNVLLCKDCQLTYLATTLQLIPKISDNM